MSNLQPARNVRSVIPRVCATCAYGVMEDGGFECQRTDGYSGDIGEMTHWLMTCDGYKLDPTYNYLDVERRVKERNKLDTGC